MGYTLWRLELLAGYWRFPKSTVSLAVPLLQNWFRFQWISCLMAQTRSVCPTGIGLCLITCLSEKATSILSSSESSSIGSWWSCVSRGNLELLKALVFLQPTFKLRILFFLSPTKRFCNLSLTFSIYKHRTSDPESDEAPLDCSPVLMKPHPAQTSLWLSMAWEPSEILAC